MVFCHQIVLPPWNPTLRFQMNKLQMCKAAPRSPLLAQDGHMRSILRSTVTTWTVIQVYLIYLEKIDSTCFEPWFELKVKLTQGIPSLVGYFLGGLQIVPTASKVVTARNGKGKMEWPNGSTYEVPMSNTGVWAIESMGTFWEGLVSQVFGRNGWWILLDFLGCSLFLGHRVFCTDILCNLVGFSSSLKDLALVTQEINQL